MRLKNPSEYMLNGRPENASGSVVSCAIEGTRPILIEVQALVCHTSFNLPRRTSTGIDFNRINLLLAVIEKRIGLHMSEYDAYINVAGGLRINEPAMDVAIIAAIISSCKDSNVNEKTICFGEVGLAGEVRAVNNAEQRVLEAARLGFETCILPAVNMASLNIKKAELGNLELVGISNIKELYKLI